MRSVFLYVVLVGLPILGVVAVLRVGERLTPPRSVGGDWTVEAPDLSAGISDCRPSWWNAGPLVMVIAQSGPDLVVTFPATPDWTLSGTIRGDTLTAATRGSSRQASAIGPGNSADLQLTLDSQAEPDRLTGILRLAGCEAALQFASRRAAAPPGLR